VVEWAPRIQAALPPEYLVIQLEWIEEEFRQMQAAAEGDRYQQLLEAFQQSVIGGA
jgi:tRNA A37 threonylcarbamoyladenosine biosynthesis protein TsaE